MYLKDIVLPKEKKRGQGKGKKIRNSQPMPNHGGGYISRCVKMEDGEMRERVKTNYASDEQFLEVVSRIGKKVIEAMDENWEPSDEAKLKLYNHNGTVVIMEISCTKYQAVEWMEL